MGRYLVPLVLLGVLVAFLGVGLGLNPRLVPSPLVGKPLPEFSLAMVDAPEKKLTPDALKGQPTLLNVWATWCVGCRQEHDLLVKIATEEKWPIYGLNYKDQFKAAQDWLSRYGNPYVASGYDPEGNVGLDLGVYGLPETFILDSKGEIRHKFVGPLTETAWREELKPILEELRK